MRQLVGLSPDAALGARLFDLVEEGAELESVLRLAHERRSPVETTLFITSPGSRERRRFSAVGFPLAGAGSRIGLMTQEVTEAHEERLVLELLKDASDALAAAGTLRQLEEVVVSEATVVPGTVATHLITIDPETDQVRFVQRVESGFERHEVDPDEHALMLAPHRLRSWLSLSRAEVVERFGRADWLQPDTVHLVAGPLGRDDEVIGTIVWQLEQPEERRSGAAMRSFASSATAAVEAIRRPELDRRLAASYQESLLPAELPVLDGLELVGRYRSAMDADRSGGDWYDVVQGHHGSAILIVGDAVGHGVDSAVDMGHVRDLTRTIALDLDSPSAILQQVDRHIDGLGQGTMAAVTVVTVDPGGGRLVIARAATPESFLRRPSGEVKVLEPPPGPFVGSGLDAEYAELGYAFDTGCLLLLVTDGVIDSAGSVVDVGLKEARAAIAGPFADLDDVCNRLIRSAARRGSQDDMVVLAALAEW